MGGSSKAGCEPTRQRIARAILRLSHTNLATKIVASQLFVFYYDTIISYQNNRIVARMILNVYHFIIPTTFRNRNKYNFVCIIKFELCEIQI
jgi:hypothetical protein